jgi:hypothetical protein
MINSRSKKPLAMLSPADNSPTGRGGQGQLFTQDFLEQGITETEQWRSLDEEGFKEFVV